MKEYVKSGQMNIFLQKAFSRGVTRDFTTCSRDWSEILEYCQNNMSTCMCLFHTNNV